MKTISGIDVAKHLVSFLDSTYSAEEGLTNVRYMCNSAFPEGCVVKPHEPGEIPHFGRIIEAYRAYGLATDNEEYLQRGKDLIDSVVVGSKKDTELSKWNFFPLYVYFKETKDEKYKEAMMHVADDVYNPEMLYSRVLFQNVGMKLWMLFDITGEQRFKNRLDDLARIAMSHDQQDAVEYYKENDFVVHRGDIRATWLLLSAYRATNNEEYLRKAADFYRGAHVENHVCSANPKIRSDLLVIAAEIIFDISEMDEKLLEEFSSMGIALLQEIVLSRIDLPDRPVFNGDGALLALHGERVNEKDSLHSAWIAQQFIRAKDYMFSVESK